MMKKVNKASIKFCLMRRHINPVTRRVFLSLGEKLVTSFFEYTNVVWNARKEKDIKILQISRVTPDNMQVFHGAFSAFHLKVTFSVKTLPRNISKNS
jgi:hypothetical protein